MRREVASAFVPCRRHLLAWGSAAERVGGAFWGSAETRGELITQHRGTAGDQTETPFYVVTKLDLSFKTEGVCSCGVGHPRGQPDGARSDSQREIRMANETKRLAQGKKQHLQPPPLPALLGTSQSPLQGLLRVSKALKRGLRDGHLFKSSRLQTGLTVCSKVRYALKCSA